MNPQTVSGQQEKSSIQTGDNKMLRDNVLTPTAESVGGMLAERATIRQRLTRQKFELEKRLDEINAALDVMDEQPQVAELVERLMRVI
jgi:hypothetical protein